MRAAFAFLAGFALAVSANLAAQYLVNNSRTVRRVVGPL
jgi:hypothetical protein